MQYNRIYDKAASASTGTMIANRAFATATTAYSGNVHGTVSTASLSGGSTDFTGVMSGVKAVCDLGTTTAALGSAYAMVVETQSSVNSQNATKFGYFNVRSLKSGGGGEGTLPSLFMNIGDTGAEVDAGTATSNMVKTDLGDAATAAGLKVMINGTTYWIQLAAYTP
ncbi:MAG TPA: hypothetical protein DCS05_09325 [Nitrospiraceae bacterium]|nr:hypothetical protein [Nitrospiraceae bacterium]